MGDTISGRALATALGVSEKAVRKAVEAGRIKREYDGRYDFAACRAAWGSATDPARSKVRARADHASGPQSAGPQVRTARSASMPPADAPALCAALDYLVALVPWGIATHGGGLQLAFDVHADLTLDLPAELRRRGFALPGPLETIDWPALADEMGLTLIDPKRMAADWQRRRDVD